MNFPTHIVTVGGLVSVSSNIGIGVQYDGVSPIPIPFHQHFENDIEEKYLVVHWDQRGTGKSYSENIPVESIILSQILKDAHELIILLKKRFNKDKIYPAGHSWGSILGINLINTYPEDF